MREQDKERFAQCIRDIKEGKHEVKNFMELFIAVDTLTRRGAVWSSIEGLIQDMLFPPETTPIPLSAEQSHVLYRIIDQQLLILDEYPFARDEKVFAQINELYQDMKDSETADRIAVFYEVYRSLITSLVAQKYNTMKHRENEEDYCGTFKQVSEIFYLLKGEDSEEEASIVD